MLSKRLECGCLGRQEGKRARKSEKYMKEREKESLSKAERETEREAQSSPLKFKVKFQNYQPKQRKTFIAHNQ